MGPNGRENLAFDIFFNTSNQKLLLFKQKFKAAYPSLSLPLKGLSATKINIVFFSKSNLKLLFPVQF